MNQRTEMHALLGGNETILARLQCMGFKKIYEDVGEG
jgi:hypothetical protein